MISAGQRVFAAPLSGRKWQLGVIVSCVLILTSGYAVSWNWPLAGDTMLMHYAVFLVRHGVSPYRTLAEINMPLTLLWEDGTMRLFGEGRTGLRVYELALGLTVVSACWFLLRKSAPMASMLAATLFLTVHLQDGVLMAGQRDLAVAVLELFAGCCFLASVDAFRLQRRALSSILALLAGMTAMTAACIKPPAVLFLVMVWVWLWWSRSRRAFSGAETVFGIIGCLLPLLASLLYLVVHGSLTAFADALHGLIPYHASLERKSVGFLLGHMLSPVAAFAVAGSVTLAVAHRHGKWSEREVLLLLGTIAGACSYLLQGKGFPYQRYPFLLFLLLLLCSQIQGEWRKTSRPRRWASLLLTILVLAESTFFIAKASRYTHEDPYAPLTNDLARVMRPDTSVQCFDTPGMCVGALYHARRVQATGFLYDCYFGDAQNAVVQEERNRFRLQFEAHRPNVIVVTDSICFGQNRSFNKFASWPWMQSEMATHYHVVTRGMDKTPLRLWSRAVEPTHYLILAENTY